MELKYLKHVPVEIYEMNQKKRRWNKLMQERFYEEIKRKDLTALEIMVDTVNTPNMLNEINSTLKELICDSASRVGALRKSKDKTTFTSNNGWFNIDKECQSKRSIFRKRLRWANKWNDKNERKAAFREYKILLRQKKKIWMTGTNLNLRRKRSENPKSYWAFFKKLDRKDERIPIEIMKMYNHFKSLNSTNVCSQIRHSDNYVNDELNKAFTENEVIKCMKKMKNGKSAGLDNVYPEFIKYISDSLIKVITKFFNRILETTEVPDEWAISIYQHVFRKGNRNDPNNYRGISLSSSLCKLFTALLTERIHNDLEKRNVLGREQAGFRKNMGCTDQIFVLTSLISLYLARKKKLFLTFIDYEKAFDRVDHGLLWTKMQSVNINGRVLEVMRNLYQKTKACVRVNGELSDVFNSRMGVRQGDKLAPILFIIYINDFKHFISQKFSGLELQPETSVNTDSSDLDSWLKMFALQYADDTVLMSESELDMQKALDATAEYCMENNMKINVAMTKFMICSRGKIRKYSDVFVYGTPIERVGTFLYLGIDVKFNNTFQTTIKNNVDKAKKALHKIAVYSGKIELETQLQIFDALIKPILLYACEVWGYENVEQIEVFHRKFFEKDIKN